MRIKFPKQSIYALITTFVFAIGLIVFATNFLIPKGKEFRANKIVLKKERLKLQRYQEFHDKVLKTYNDEKSKNRKIIQAIKNKFERDVFLQHHKRYFISLDITKPKKDNNSSHQWYEVYNVDAISDMKSPVNFYKFIDSLNRSENIIAIEFPINFIREDDKIKSSFKIKIFKKRVENKNS